MATRATNPSTGSAAAADRELLDRLVSLAKAADLTACSVFTIRRRITDGTLTGYRFGPRRILVDRDELERKLRPIPNAAGPDEA